MGIQLGAEQQPESLDRATTLADVHIDARTASRDQSRLPAGRRSDNYREKTSHQRRDEHSRQETSNRSFSAPEKRDKSESKKESEETNKRLPRFDPVKGPRCFHCNRFGHMAAACTDKVHQVNLAEERNSIGQWPGRIGKHETTALRIDTGATISVVHRKLISNEELTGRQVAIKPLDAEPRWYPTAFIEVEVDNWRAFREVAVSNTIAYDAILGLDIPVIRALVYRPSAPAEVFQVQTRATSKRDANTLQEDGEAEEWREAEIPNQIIAAATECHESDETSMPTTESDSDENDTTQLELDEYWLHQERTDRSVLTPEERLERKQEELSRKKQPDRDQLVSEQCQDTTEHSDEEEDEEAMLETWKQLHTEGEIVLEPGTSLEQGAELKDLVDAFRKSVCSGRTKQTPFTELQIQTKPPTLPHAQSSA